MLHELSASSTGSSRPVSPLSPPSPPVPTERLRSRTLRFKDQSTAGSSLLPSYLPLGTSIQFQAQRRVSPIALACRR